MISAIGNGISAMKRVSASNRNQSTRLVLPVSDDHQLSPSPVIHHRSSSVPLHSFLFYYTIFSDSNGAFELLCEYKRSSHENIISTHIHAAANYIGYLPGEVINRSILHLFHPYDMAQIKQIHANLSVQRNEVVRQRRLRWIAFNGSIIHTNSEWFVFWNPWTHKVDSIIGRHTLNEQPIGNANVLADPCTQRIITPLDEFTIHNIESEITAILNKEPRILIKDERYKAAPIAHQKNSNSVDQKSSSTHLGTYIDNLIETFVINAANSGNKYSTPVTDACRSPINPTDLSSLNCCNAIPLTYNQINCLENVHRLLKSQQHTANIAAAQITIEPTPENVSSSKLRLIEEAVEDSKSPLPISEQEDDSRISADVVTPAMPLTRELLQQHTRKWEEEYRDTWKKRFGLKRSIQQTEFTVPVSSKFFRESSHRPGVTQNISAVLPSSRSDYWPPMNKDDYYRSLGPNPPPPPGKNFQITSVPLPPALPIEERRKQHSTLGITTVTSATTERYFPTQYQYRSVIKSALASAPQQQRQYFESNRMALPPSTGTVQRYLSTGNLMDTSLEWCSTTEDQGTCAARLINMAQRAQQQLEQKRFHSPLATSPVKEATDALMLLQETTSFN
ncbi:DNA topoisomerase [Dirofilaria immitis]|nr:DNA topoisomerase [Dirofilaria immitis]